MDEAGFFKKKKRRSFEYFYSRANPLLVQHQKRYRMKCVNNDLLVTSITTDEACFLNIKSMYLYIPFEFICEINTEGFYSVAETYD